MERITNTVDLLKKIKEGDVVTVHFIKKSGEKRIMRCTLNFSRIPPEHRPKSLKLENILSSIDKNMLRVYDVDAAGWRTIPIDNTDFIITGGKQYQVKLEKGKK
jgi:hypothetical protein